MLITALGTLKPNYILLLLATFYISEDFCYLEKSKKLIISISIFLSIALSIGWSSVASTFFLTRENDLVDPFLQLKFIVANPIVFLNILFTVIKNNAWGYYLQSVGIAGYGYWPLPRNNLLSVTGYGGTGIIHRNVFCAIH